MKKPNDQLRLRHILDAIEIVSQHLAGIDEETFHEDRKTQDAVVRQLEIIGEAAANLTPELRNENPHVRWKDAAGARNRLIHGYFDIDTEIIWDIVEIDLPILKKQVEHIFEDQL